MAAVAATIDDSRAIRVARPIFPGESATGESVRYGFLVIAIFRGKRSGKIERPMSQRARTTQKRRNKSRTARASERTNGERTECSRGARVAKLRVGLWLGTWHEMKRAYPRAIDNYSGSIVDSVNSKRPAVLPSNI